MTARTPSIMTSRNRKPGQDTNRCCRWFTNPSEYLRLWVSIFAGRTDLPQRLLHQCMATPNRISWPKLMTLVAVITVSLFRTGLTWADSVKLGSFWIDGVSVSNIANGKVYYYNDIGDEFVKPLDQLFGLKLDQYPELSRYESAVAAGDDQAALQALTQLQNNAREPWVKQWAQYHLSSVYDRLNQPVRAIESFLQLAYSGADDFYLSQVSLKSARKANDQLRQDLIARLEAARLEVGTQSQSDAIVRLLDQIQGKAGPNASSATTTQIQRPGSTGHTDPQTATGATSPSGDGGSGSNLPRVLDLGDPISKMLLTSHYEQAASAAQRALSTESKQVSMRLFQRGIALSRLAEISGDHADLLDAGLNFMKVVIYFPDSNFAGPSLVEAGWVHYKIDRLDVARRLLNQATVLIDAVDDPPYAARLDQLIAQVGQD